MQAQLSELQKMFCQLSESGNVNKNRVELTLVCLSLTLNLPILNDVSQRVIKNAHSDETASINS